MEKTIILNDTRRYHHGCAQVMKALEAYYKPYATYGMRALLEPKHLEDADIVVFNGEGVCHHDGKRGVRILGYIKMAQEMKKKTHLINAVWQDMSDEYKQIARKCDVIEVREVLSQKEIDCEANIVLDASLHLPVEGLVSEHKEGVCVGGSFYKELVIDYPHDKIDIFTQDWNSLVKRLSKAKLLITGRHHEMYAALKARTPVITVKGNTWKNEGFFHTLQKADLLLAPTIKNIEHILNGKYDKSWNDVWRYLDNCIYKYNINSTIQP